MTRTDRIVSALLMAAAGLLMSYLLVGDFGNSTGALRSLYNLLLLLAWAAYYGGLGWLAVLVFAKQFSPADPVEVTE